MQSSAWWRAAHNFTAANASFRHTKNEHGQDQFAVGIAIGMEHVAEATLVRLVHNTLEIAVRLSARINASVHR